MSKENQADWYMQVYQTVAGAAIVSIPDKDTSLPERAQNQLELANIYAVKAMDALANIITLIDDPDTPEDELL